MQYLFLPLVLVAMYALVYLPQQRQKKAMAELLNSLTEGDAVLTTSGIYGVIVEVSGGDVFVEVAPGIELKMSKSAVLRKVDASSDHSSEGK